MIVELSQETPVGGGTMYVVRGDGSALKWFVHLEDAQTYYDEVIANPDLLKPVKNILKSQEISLSLEETIN